MEELKTKMRYGNVGLGERPEMPAGWEKGGYRPGIDPDTKYQPFFGLTVVSCEKGDMRQSQDNLIIYGDEKREVRSKRQSAGGTALSTRSTDAFSMADPYCTMAVGARQP